MVKVVSHPPAPTQQRPTSAHAPGGQPPKVPPFRLMESQTLALSRDDALALAREHLALPRSPTEREPDAKRLRELTVRIQAGLLLPCLWATVVYKGVKYRMNGQHSSQAFVEAAESLPESVVIHLDHYEADGREGMGVLFRQFDARFSARSKQDTAGAYQGLVEELRGVSRRKAKLGIEGIAWYNRVVEGLAVKSGDDLYQEFLHEAYHPFLRWMDKILSLKTPEMERAPVVAAMYGTFLASESGAQEFWGHVAKNDLADDSDPRAVLSQDLQRAKESKEPKDHLSPAEFYSKCVKAWAAFRNGDKVRSLNVNPKKGLPDIAA